MKYINGFDYKMIVLITLSFPFFPSYNSHQMPSEKRKLDDSVYSFDDSEFANTDGGVQSVQNITGNMRTNDNNNNLSSNTSSGEENNSNDDSTKKEGRDNIHSNINENKPNPETDHPLGELTVAEMVNEE